MAFEIKHDVSKLRMAPVKPVERNPRARKPKAEIPKPAPVTEFKHEPFDGEWKFGFEQKFIYKDGLLIYPRGEIIGECVHGFPNRREINEVNLVFPHLNIDEVLSYKTGLFVYKNRHGNIWFLKLKPRKPAN